MKSLAIATALLMAPMLCAFTIDFGTPTIVCGAHLNDEVIEMGTTPDYEGYYYGYSKDLTAMIHIMIDANRNRAEIHLTETLDDPDFAELKTKLQGNSSKALQRLLKRRDHKYVVGFYSDFIDFHIDQDDRNLSISCAKKAN